MTPATAEVLTGGGQGQRTRESLSRLGRTLNCIQPGHVNDQTNGNAGCTLVVAQVMISMPDDSLVRVDARASAHRSTHSATIHELAEAGLGERQRRLSEHMAVTRVRLPLPASSA